MRGRLTDQAAVAVALAQAIAGTAVPSVGHLVAGLAAEPEGRAGRRLRERGWAAAQLTERAGEVSAPPLPVAVSQALTAAGAHAATTVDLLDAALARGGAALADLLSDCGYHRDLDGWLLSDPATDWFEQAETYGFQPSGNATFDRAASRVIAQVRAVNGGAVSLLIAASAAPDAGLDSPDPRTLAQVADRLPATAAHWDLGLDAVLGAAQILTDGACATVSDLVRAALVAGGDGPKVILQLAAESG